MEHLTTGFYNLALLLCLFIYFIWCIYCTYITSEKKKKWLEWGSRSDDVGQLWSNDAETDYREEEKKRNKSWSIFLLFFVFFGTIIKSLSLKF
ncbi:MAG: hypothetical protein V7749_00950 [Cocleimonas sp.]